MMRLVKSVLLLSLTIMSALPAAAQTKEELQDSIKKIEQEIKTATELLNKSSENRKASESELKVIRSQITSRRTLISSLDKQLGVLEGDIKARNKTIGRLNSELDRLKKSYAEMIYSSYKDYKLNNFMLFLFSSSDFNEATRRVDFMRRYNRFREQKAGEIRAMRDSILVEVSGLDDSRKELDRTKQARNGELLSLSKDETKYKTAVTQLKSQESKLSKELQQKRNDKEKAEKKIQELIAEEARRNRSTKTTTEEARRITELSGRFEQNKGGLPYPVTGVVIDRFGEHAHSVVRTSKIRNNGINIAAEKGAEVRCVFDGTVTAIFDASVLNNCIIVRHGDYVTVYANVSTVSVKTGDRVKLNQRLGRLPDGDDKDTHFLHFEVLENGAHVNPELWIRR